MIEGTIDIQDQVTQRLLATHAALRSRRPMHAAMARRGVNVLRSHFLGRNQQPNKTGWPKQNFWGRIRSATNVGSVDDQGADMVIADPAIALRIHGGTVRPREAKFLAIPARAEAYGKSPRVFDDLRFVPTGTGGMLVQRDKTVLTRSRSGRITGGQTVGGLTYYFLVRSVTQRPDPDALPSRASMEAALLDEVDKFIARHLGRVGA